MHQDARWFLDYERRVAGRLTTRVLPVPGGLAFLDDAFPLRYDSNYLELFEPAPGVTVEDLTAEADRVLDGFGHREVLINHEADGERLEPAFAEAGWTVERDALMVLRREPDRPGALAVRRSGSRRRAR